MAALDIRLEGLESEDAGLFDTDIYKIIKSYLQPGDAASAQETAGRLHAFRPDVRLEAGYPNGERESLRVFMQDFWILYIEMAAEIPYDHPSQQRMLDLELALRELKTPEGVGWYSPSTALHEWISSYGFDPRSTDPKNLTGKFRTTNIYVFAARETQIRYDDYAYVAIWAMAEALENIPDPRARAWHTQGPVLDAWVPIAAEWMRLTGDLLLDNCRNEVETYGQPFPNNKRGRRGFFMDRWQFWKAGFGRVKEMEQASGATKSMAEAALTRMIELESSSSSTEKTGEAA